MTPTADAKPPVPIFRRIVFPPLLVEDFLSMQTHFEDVARELQLIEVGGHLGEDIPIHVSTLTDALRRSRTAMRDEARRQAMVAFHAGQKEFRLDLVLPVPSHPVVQAMVDLFDQTDLWSERGVLLTPVAPPGARHVLRVIIDHLEDVQAADRPVATPAPSLD
jgi:hypothetical protein